MVHLRNIYVMTGKKMNVFVHYQQAHPSLCKHPPICVNGRKFNSCLNWGSWPLLKILFLLSHMALLFSLLILIFKNNRVTLKVVNKKDSTENQSKILRLSECHLKQTITHLSSPRPRPHAL